MNVMRTKEIVGTFEPIGKNVGHAIVYFLIGVAFVIMCFALSMIPFVTKVDGGDYFLIAIIFSFVLLVAALYYFSTYGWFSRRLRWLGDGQMTIFGIGIGKRKLLYSNDDKEGISYNYRPGDRHFSLGRTIFVNPVHFEKDWEKRKNQLRKRLEQTHIPFNLEDSIYRTCHSLYISIELLKQNATKENVCCIRDIMRDLAKEDYDQHLFARLVFGDDTLYVEFFRYDIVRAIRIRNEGETECFSPQASEEDFRLLSNYFLDMYEENWMEEIQPEDLIESDDFERIWMKYVFISS